MFSTRCAHCRWHARAEAKPDSLLSRLWRWHTRWCPMWKSYQRHLAQAPTAPPVQRPPRS